MRYFEDFEVGQVIELGSHRLTEPEIIAFAREYDPQPFHLDHEKGKASLFGGLAASGWHTGAIIMRMFADTVLKETESMGSPGVEDLRWLKPVYPGDTISGRTVILETRTSNSRPNMGIVKHRWEGRNQAGEIVMTLVATNFFGRRPQPETV